ncbi:MAG: hypothetical protein ACRET1_02155, partial [Burkholderiales bacterium]
MRHSILVELSSGFQRRVRSSLPEPAAGTAKKHIILAKSSDGSNESATTNPGNSAHAMKLHLDVGPGQNFVT